MPAPGISAKRKEEVSSGAGGGGRQWRRSMDGASESRSAVLSQRAPGQGVPPTSHLREAAWLVAVAAVGLGIVFSRRPDAFLRPQLWAEDGAFWFHDAYDFGPWAPLLWPHAGYFETFPRVVSDMALALPLRLLPAWDNSIAAAVQLLPALMVASRRFSQVVPSRWVRLWLALAYLAVPNSYELNVNLTNAQWHLALAAALAALAPALSKAGKAADTALLAVSGLTGPFALALAIPAWISALWYRGRWRIFVAAWVSLFAAVQLASLLTQQRVAGAGPVKLGASPARAVHILAGQVVAGLLVGQAGYGWLLHQAWWPTAAYGVVGLAVLAGAYCMAKAPVELRLFVLFAGCILGGALLSPAGAGLPAWVRLAEAGYGPRYWLIPMLALAACLTWMAGRERVWFARIFAAAAIATMIGTGMRLDWQYPPMPNLHFPRYAAAFERARPGQVVRIPILLPPYWTMELTKH